MPSSTYHIIVVVGRRHCLFYYHISHLWSFGHMLKFVGISQTNLQLKSYLTNCYALSSQPHTQAQTYQCNNTSNYLYNMLW